MDTFEIIVSFILVAVVATDLLAAFLLLRGAVRSHYSIIALNERAFVAATQATSGIMLAFLGLNRLFGWHLQTELVLVILSAAVIIQALPGAVWLSLYFLHKFGPADVADRIEEANGKR